MAVCPASISLGATLSGCGWLSIAATEAKSRNREKDGDSRAFCALTMDTTDEVLAKLLKSPKDRLSDSEIKTLIRAFLPSCSPATRSSAYLALSAQCQRAKGGKQGEAVAKPSEVIVSTFSSHVISSLQETQDEDISASLTFMTALFQVDPPSATTIFLRDAFEPSLTEVLETNSTQSVLVHITHLLSQASGQKSCRSAIPVEQRTWLEEQSRQASDTALRTAAAVALVKLEAGMVLDAPPSSSPQTTSRGSHMADLLRNAVISEEDEETISDAIEGLAYTSRDPVVKDRLSSDPAFLRRLFALIPQSKGKVSPRKDNASTLIYGVVLVTLNLVAYQPQLTGEQAQMAKLKRMANAGAGAMGKLHDPGQDILNDDTHVRQRGRRLVEAGAANALTSAIRATESRGVRLAASKALKHIIEDKETRGKVLQSGGGKALMLVIRGILENSASEPEDLEPFQALAKLAITSSPLQVFGPDAGATHDAIRPLSVLFTHSSCTLLQQFEALMALTNISSLGPEAAQRVTTSPDLLTKVETLLLDDHDMVRRAAVELLCNLITGSDAIFGRYTEGPGARSKLRILTALADVADVPTRLAASGALATLTMSPQACSALTSLEVETHRILPVMNGLIQPLDDAVPEEALVQAAPGLVHRGVVCLRNLLIVTKDSEVHRQVVDNMDQAGTVKALVNIVRDGQNGGNQAILASTAEALKSLIEAGVKINQ